MKRFAACFTGLCLICAGGAQAAFSVVDDFESLALGEDFRDPGNNSNLLDGAGGWVGAAQPPAVFEVGVDPTLAANQVLNVYSTSRSNGNLLFPNVITDGTTGTLFLRVRLGADEDPQNTGFDPFALWGLSHRNSLEASDITGFGGVLTAYSWVGTGQNDDLANFRYYDGGGQDVTPGLNTDTWYNFWFVADADADTYDIYVQSDGDVNYATQTQIANDAGFRNAGSQNLSVIIKQGDHFDGQFWFDDIYVDAAGENLANPIPEPTTMALIALGGLTLLGPRRH